MEAQGRDLLFRPSEGVLTGYSVEYSVDFRNGCSYAVDVHSVACYTRDGVQPPGHPNDWLYVAPQGTERQWYYLGFYEEDADFAIKVGYRACRAGNRLACGRAEVVCP